MKRILIGLMPAALTLLLLVFHGPIFDWLGSILTEPRASATILASTFGFAGVIVALWYNGKQSTDAQKAHWHQEDERAEKAARKERIALMSAFRTELDLNIAVIDGFLTNLGQENENAADEGQASSRADTIVKEGWTAHRTVFMANADKMGLLDTKISGLVLRGYAAADIQVVGASGGQVSWDNAIEFARRARQKTEIIRTIVVILDTGIRLEQSRLTAKHTDSAPDTPES